MLLWSTFILFLILSLTACKTATSIPEPDWLAVNDFLYQLQRARPNRIGETAFDLVVVSIGAAGGSPEVIENLKHCLKPFKVIFNDLALSPPCQSGCCGRRQQGMNRNPVRLAEINGTPKSLFRAHSLDLGDERLGQFPPELCDRGFVFQLVIM